MKATLLSFMAILSMVTCHGQSQAYQIKKSEKLSKDSPFTQIIKRELPADIKYEDDDIIAFIPLRKQAPVHLLIVPKKRIPTINDATTEDIDVLGKMYLVAKKLALETGVSESGYRLAINNNEDSGQSVFHLHMHLLGGMKLGPMLPQTYVDKSDSVKKKD